MEAAICLVTFDVDGTLIESEGESSNKMHKDAFAASFDKSESQRFGGQDSIYNAPAGPAVTAYDPAAVKDAAVSVTAASFANGNADRFAGHDSQYNVPAGPAVTAYDPTASIEAIQDSKSSHVKSFESGNADRFAGPDSLYRKGLRRSTIPEARDPSSFPAAAGGVKPTIAKSGNAARGAALKANLKAMISKDSSMLGAVAEEEQENTA